MNPLIVRNSRIPRSLSLFIDIYAITLFPFVFIRDDGDAITLQHESIHIHQQRELFVLFFYLLYVMDWMIGLVKYRDRGAAYCRIRFEQEAYAHESFPDYLQERKKFAWREYRV